MTEPMEPIRFRTHSTISDLISTSAELMRESPVAGVMGGYVVASTGLSFLESPRLFTLVFLAFGLAILTGLLAVPFVALAARRRRDLVSADVEFEADASSLAMESVAGTARQPWSVYRRARERSRSFTLEVGTGANVMVSKRGMTPADIVAFRGLLASLNLLRARTLVQQLRGVIWLAIGLATGITFILILPTL